MSYILDALRRADSERDRERGAVPGIYAQPVPVPSPEDFERRRGASRPWGWIALGLLGAALLVVLGGWLFGRDTAPPETVVAPAPLPVTPEPRAAEPAPPVAAAAPPVATAPPPVAVLPAPIERRPTTSEAASAERKAGAPAPAASAPAAERIYARHELPEEIRRQVPPVNVSGSMYSPDPANRFLIINGQLVHEKAELGPGHTLMQIKLRAAVLRFRDVLYEITF
jgi:general secretion pathway protein B